MKRKVEILITAILLIAAIAIIGTYGYKKPSVASSDKEKKSCCHAKKHAGIPIITYAQEPEEEGNPGHVKPTQSCSGNPKSGQVGCKCFKHKKCEMDEDEEGKPYVRVVESKTCKSYCFKDFCLCADPPCV